MLNSYANFLSLSGLYKILLNQYFMSMCLLHQDNVQSVGHYKNKLI